MPSLQSIARSIAGAIYPTWGGGGWRSPTVVIPGARYDYQSSAGDLWANSVVAIAIKWLGDRFPRAKLHVSRVARDGKFKPMPGHPLGLLWQRPNPYYSRRVLEKAIGLSLVTDGNAYIQKVRDGRGRVAELWWLPPYDVEPWWEGDDFITGYQVNMLGYPSRRLPREDVIHIVDVLDPNNLRKGMSALGAQLREVSAINEEGSYTPSILRNAGVPGLVLVPNDPNLRNIKKEDAEEIKARIGEATQGEKRGSAVILKGNYKVEPIGFSPEQLTLDKIMQLPMAKVAGACGVALMSMGLPDPGKTYSNLEEANKYSWGTVCSIQEMIGEVVGHDLLPEFGFDPSAYAIEYDYSEIQELQESEDAVWTRVGDGWKKGLLTQNEARDMIGLDADPDGDRFHPGTGSPDDATRELQIAKATQLLGGGGANPATQPGVQEGTAVPGLPVLEPSGTGNGTAKRWQY